MISVNQPAQTQTERDAQRCAKQTDQHPLEHEDAHNAARRRALRAQNRNVAVLFDDHHRQRRDDIERRHYDQQHEKDDDHFLLQLQSGKK